MEDAGRGPEKGHGEDRPRPLPQGEVQVQKRPQAQGLQLVAVAMGKKVRWLEEEEWDDENLRNRFFSPEGDFDRYEGTWVFLPEGEGTRVVLTLTYELNIPIFGGLLQKLVQKLMQENVESLLKGLEERVLAASS